MSRSSGSLTAPAGRGVGVGATQVPSVRPPVGLVTSVGVRAAEISQIMPPTTTSTTTAARISTLRVILPVERSWSSSPAWGAGAGPLTRRWAR